jgi:hypothetical protein
MPLEDDGFLSEEAQKHAAKEAAEYRQIFNYLKDVNAKAHQFLREVRSNPEDGKHVFALAFFARALSAFQALKILAELGFISECRVTCRNLFEVKFRLGFLEHKSDAVALFIAEHARFKIKRLRNMRDGKIKLKRPPASGCNGLILSLANLKRPIPRGCPNVWNMPSRSERDLAMASACQPQRNTSRVIWTGTASTPILG